MREALSNTKVNITPNFSLSKEKILQDFRIIVESREVSNLGYKEVHSGKASFGIFGGGKELPQVVMAHFFKKGDFRSGYYRDQTFMFAIKEMTPQQLFAQLYSHTDIAHEPVSAGRLMTGHFGTRFLNDDGSWKNLSELNNSTTDISPTAAQMPRLVGLAQASKLFRKNENLHSLTNFSNQGNEIAFGTIGNGSTSEGLFFEAINAAGVMQIPMLISIWDDEYGISVPNELQTTKGSISKALSGFQRTESEEGYEIINVNGWDYPALINAYDKASSLCRKEHVPVLIHVKEVTQPNGHSTSGSHSRYKGKDRLAWEKEYDCITKMQEWIIDQEIASLEELKQIEKDAKVHVRESRKIAWKHYQDSMIDDVKDFLRIAKKTATSSQYKKEIITIQKQIASQKDTMSVCAVIWN